MSIEARQAAPYCSAALLELWTTGLLSRLSEANLLALLRVSPLSFLRIFLLLKVAKMCDLLLDVHVCDALGLHGTGNGLHWDVQRQKIVV
jgi:hypothetical protein